MGVLPTGFEPARTNKGFNMATLNLMPSHIMRHVYQFRHGRKIFIQQRFCRNFRFLQELHGPNRHKCG